MCGGVLGKVELAASEGGVMPIESLGLVTDGRIRVADPSTATAVDRTKPTSVAGQATGKIKVAVPQGGAKLYVKFGMSDAVTINSAALNNETNVHILEVGELLVLNTYGATHVAVYSAAAWEVNLFEVIL